jgi:hypothetical protein
MLCKVSPKNAISGFYREKKPNHCIEFVREKKMQNTNLNKY